MTYDIPSQYAAEVLLCWNARENAIALDRESLIQLADAFLDKALDKCSEALGKPPVPRPDIIDSEGTLKLNYGTE